MGRGRKGQGKATTSLQCPDSSCRARHSFKGLRDRRTFSFHDCAVNVPLFRRVDSSTSREAHRRSAYGARCSAVRCAYRRTISGLSHPPNSWRAKSGVPHYVCQLARVCCRSCHLKPSMPARCCASYQALVLTCVAASPGSRTHASDVSRANAGRCSRHPHRAVAQSPSAPWSARNVPTQAAERCPLGTSRPVTFERRNPVANVNSAMSARCGGNQASSPCTAADRVQVLAVQVPIEPSR